MKNYIPAHCVLRFVQCIHVNEEIKRGGCVRVIVCMSVYVFQCVYVCVSVFECVCTYPLQRVDRGVVLSRLEVFGEEAVWDGGELLIARVPLALVPGIAHLGDTQPLLLRHLRQLPLHTERREREEGEREEGRKDEGEALKK